MRASLLFWSFFSWSLVVFPISAESEAPPATPQALEQAVRAGDSAEVGRLIDAGVDVNAELRHRFTAIFHAVDRNQRDIVELLLKKGARIDLIEGFFQSTPLERALDNGYKELALLLLAQPEPGRLDYVLQNPDIDIVRAALQVASPFYHYQKQSALQAARQAENQELVELIEETPAVDGWPDIRLDGPYLRTLTGTFVEQDPESAPWSLSLSDASKGPPELVLTHGDRAWSDWVAVGDRQFRSTSKPEFGFAFLGRGGTIEGMFVFGDGDSRMLRRSAPVDDEPETAKNPIAQEAPQETSATRGLWSSFRGPDGSGIADGLGLVSSWDVESGKNIRWRTEVPGLGLGSPITDGRRVYLTTAINEKGDAGVQLGHYGNPASVEDDSVHSWQVMAYSLTDGALIWQKTSAVKSPDSRRHLKSSQANSTAVTDGNLVIVVFPTAGLFAYRAEDGELLWHRDLGPLPSGPYGGTLEWGFASSPILWNGKVILQVDIHGGAYIAAWNARTGEPVWRTARDEIPSWSTPIVVEGPTGPELVTSATTIRGYDPRDGRPLWSLGPNSEVVVSSPIADDGLIYVTGGYPPAKPIYAIRPGSKGDLSAKVGSNQGLAWSKPRGGVYIPTPLSYRGVLYLIHGQGRLEALDRRTGDRLYRARLSAGGTVSGSPIVADGRIFVPTEEGRIYVLEAGASYRELSIQELGEATMTTPAAVEGTLLIRGLKHLFAMGQPAAAANHEAAGDPADGDPAAGGPAAGDPAAGGPADGGP